MTIFINRIKIYEFVKFTVLFSILLSVTFILGVITIQNADAAVDMFLKIEGVKGESQDSIHKDEIDVLSWSWGMSNPGTTHTGSGGAGAGRVNVQDLSFTKYMDKSTPLLLLSCANGEHYNEATLFVRKAGSEKALEFFTLKMQDIIVSSVSTGASGGDDRPTENVSLNFAKVQWKYTEQKADGTAGASIGHGWDIAENKPLPSP